ncbi:hypothetical protein NL676_037599 [Syzygium grande]|nr:hypothetical protein NL676_037599 [Syzygium grande]
MELGNPLLDSQISVDGATFLWSHGVISGETLKLKETVCNDSRYLMELIHHKISTECTEVFEKQVEEMGNFTDPGDVLEPYCFSGTAAMQSASSSAWDAYHDEILFPIFKTHTLVKRHPLKISSEPAYSIRMKQPRNKTMKASSCPLSYHAVELGNNIIPLLSALIKEHLLVLLFSGDQDSKIPLTQTRMIANMIARDLKFTSLGWWMDAVIWYVKKREERNSYDVRHGSRSGSRGPVHSAIAGSHLLQSISRGILSTESAVQELIQSRLLLPAQLVNEYERPNG